MAHEVSLGNVEQIPLGEGRAFVAGRERIAVFRTRGGELFAVQALCPHRGGPLADGLVGERSVICPLHERQFDLQTGTGLGCDESLRRFPVRLDLDGSMFVSVG